MQTHVTAQLTDGSEIDRPFMWVNYHETYVVLVEKPNILETRIPWSSIITIRTVRV